MTNYNSATSVVIQRLREECEKAGSRKAWALAHGYSPQFITDLLRGRRAITLRVAKDLQFELVMVWKDLRDT